MTIANQDDLTGYGFSSQQSALVGAIPQKITGIGATVQTGAAVLITRMAELNPSAVTANSFIIPSDAKIMNPFFLTNQQGTNPAYVFVPSGHSLNGTANGSVSIGATTATSNTAIIWQYKVKNWTFK
jgi:hypothetical protein